MCKELADRIEEGEGQHLDFKYAVTDSKKIARSLAAFANSDGGSLLLGVKDNGRIVGVNSDEEYYMIETAAHIFCKPEVKFSVCRWDVMGKTVLEIIVESSAKAPHTAPDKENKATTYIRVNDENIKVGLLHTLYLKRMNSMSKPVNIGERHKQIVDLLTAEGECTYNKVLRKLHLSSKEAMSMVLDLLSVNVIGIRSDEKGTLLFALD